MRGLGRGEIMHFDGAQRGRRLRLNDLGNPACGRAAVNEAAAQLSFGAVAESEAGQ
jgi:hypothetical protein